ncbi:avidin/streptavidin family protein [Tunturibacter empetritectus]|uniref:avidin/streptavidin family protein n=1 Tax=Tunturiibacter empetritectus TaxID=3069691 RepID=UPI003872B978
MVIFPVGNDPRIITGTYHTAVGSAQQRNYGLAGGCDAAGGTSQTVGWAVAFEPPDADKPEPSTCAWSGQLHETAPDGSPLEFIASTWVLTSASDAADDWESTQVGKNYFFRNPPTPDQLNRAISLIRQRR